MSEQKTKECPGGCTHSDEQHKAFDEGLAAGEEGLSEDDCPYSDLYLREDWKTGFSVTGSYGD
jgi:ribosome modulation factor